MKDWIPFCEFYGITVNLLTLEDETCTDVLIDLTTVVYGSFFREGHVMLITSNTKWLQLGHLQKNK